MRAPHIFETIVYVEDLDAAAKFYQEVMRLELVSTMPGRGLAFRCSGSVLLVFDPRQTRIKNLPVPVHGAHGAGHVAFLAFEHELPEWREHLNRCHVAIETEVDWPQGGRSIYFRDPGGNSVELAPPTLWGFEGRVPGVNA